MPMARFTYETRSGVFYTTRKLDADFSYSEKADQENVGYSTPFNEVNNSVQSSTRPLWTKISTGL